VLKKKIWAKFQRIIELFTQKFVTKLSKVWVGDPGSEIRDPGVKKAPDPGSVSATLEHTNAERNEVGEKRRRNFEGEDKIWIALHDQPISQVLGFLSGYGILFGSYP
jgi:hypothetical protein